LDRVDDRIQTAREEIANSVSHGLGGVAAIVASPVLIAGAAQHGSAQTVGVSIFVGTMVLAYFASMVYHGWPQSRARRLFEHLDHSSIYLFIAGTYTAFALGTLHSIGNRILFFAVWTLAAIGIVLKTSNWLVHPLCSNALYLAMGWLVLIAVPLTVPLSTFSLCWLAAGGVAYTAGWLFFSVWRRLRYSHLVWHMFVIGGTSCHFVSVLAFAR
jgi:hemolysin III